MLRRSTLRRAGLLAGALAIVLAASFVLLRDAEMFAVDDVVVRGASGPDAPKVEAALRDAARGMTTLAVDSEELRDVTAPYPTVRGLEVDRDLPHGLTITVLESRPVAVVESAGRRVPLAADGRLLQGATPPGDVPELEVERITGTRIDDPRGRQLVALVAAAPLPLRRRALKAELVDGSLQLKMERGPDLVFGRATDLEAKWAAVARVLADPTTEGATYVDVRVPERAAAGGLAPLVEPVDPSTAAPAETTPPTTPAPQPAPQDQAAGQPSVSTGG